MNNINELIKQRLKDKTQAEIGKMMDMTQVSVSNKFLGKRQWSMDDLQKLVYLKVLTKKEVVEWITRDL